MTNGWRDGSDPVQRWLRVVTVIVCLGVFVYLASGPSRLDVLPLAGLALGATLMLLGYESVIRLPGIGRKRDDDD
jgi:hypothetical protein